MQLFRVRLMLMHSLINCQAQVMVKWFDVVKNIVKLRVRVRVKVKSLKSKLDPEVGVVMGWPTTTHHHHTTFFELKSAN